MKRNTVIAASLALFATIGISSCQKFFTDSWADGLARDSYSIPSDLPAEDAIELLAESNGDPALAAALVAPLYNAANGAAPGSLEYYVAASGLVDAVMASSEVGAAMIEALTLLETDPNAAMDAILAVSLTDAEIQALTLVSATPAAMSAVEAYSLAIALMAEAVRNVGVVDPMNITDPEYTALSADAAYLLAQDYIALAGMMESVPQTAMELMLSGMVPIFEDPTP